MRHGSHTLPDEFRAKAGKDYLYKQVRCKRRLYGEIRKYPTGQIVYLAHRRPDEVFFKADAWAFDVETIELAKIMGCKFIGVLVTNGDRYVARIEAASKAGGAVVLDYSKHVGTAPGAKGALGARQWYIPRHLFVSEKDVAGELKLMTLPKRA